MFKGRSWDLLHITTRALQARPSDTKRQPRLTLRFVCSHSVALLFVEVVTAHTPGGGPLLDTRPGRLAGGAGFLASCHSHREAAALRWSSRQRFARANGEQAADALALRWPDMSHTVSLVRPLCFDHTPRGQERLHCRAALEARRLWAVGRRDLMAMCAPPPHVPLLGLLHGWELRTAPH